jgi:hypothetical protein
MPLWESLSGNKARFPGEAAEIDIVEIYDLGIRLEAVAKLKLSNGVILSEAKNLAFSAG